MFARLGNMYAWATPEYLLDHMTFDQIVMYYEYGQEWEEQKANIMVSRQAIGLFGAKEKPKPKKSAKDNSDKPDKEAFYKTYPNRIKRPEGGGS